MGELVAKRPARRGFIEELIIQAVAVGGLLLSLRLALKYLDPYREQREAVRQPVQYIAAWEKTPQGSAVQCRVPRAGQDSKATRPVAQGAQCSPCALPVLSRTAGQEARCIPQAGARQEPRAQRVRAAPGCTGHQPKAHRRRPGRCQRIRWWAQAQHTAR